MKGTRFSEERIIGILKEAERASGIPGWYAAGGGTMDPVSDKGAYVEGRHICSRGS